MANKYDTWKTSSMNNKKNYFPSCLPTPTVQLPDWNLRGWQASKDPRGGDGSLRPLEDV